MPGLKITNSPALTAKKAQPNLRATVTTSVQLADKLLLIQGGGLLLVQGGHLLIIS